MPAIPSGYRSGSSSMSANDDHLRRQVVNNDPKTRTGSGTRITLRSYPGGRGYTPWGSGAVLGHGKRAGQHTRGSPSAQHPLLPVPAHKQRTHAAGALCHPRPTPGTPPHLAECPAYPIPRPPLGRSAVTASD